jgi:hypothetical protein
MGVATSQSVLSMHKFLYVSDADCELKSTAVCSVVFFFTLATANKRYRGVVPGLEFSNPTRSRQEIIMRQQRQDGINAETRAWQGVKFNRLFGGKIAN